MTVQYAKWIKRVIIRIRVCPLINACVTLCLHYEWLFLGFVRLHKKKNPPNHPIHLEKILFYCMMVNQIKKKLFICVFFLECSVYVWHPRPISNLDTLVFHLFTFQNTVLFQTPRSQKQQTHLLPICTRRLWNRKSAFWRESCNLMTWHLALIGPAQIQDRSGGSCRPRWPPPPTWAGP